MTSYLVTIATDAHQSYVKMGIAHSYWKRQVEMMIRLGKIQEKPYWGGGGGAGIHPPCTPEG